MDGAGPDPAHGQAGDRQQPPSGPAPCLPTGRLDKPLRALPTIPGTTLRRSASRTSWVAPTAHSPDDDFPPTYFRAFGPGHAEERRAELAEEAIEHMARVGPLQEIRAGPLQVDRPSLPRPTPPRRGPSAGGPRVRGATGPSTDDDDVMRLASAGQALTEGGQGFVEAGVAEHVGKIVGAIRDIHILDLRCPRSESPCVVAV